MAKLLFHLNGVEHDEAEDVRLILDEEQIEFYETNAGKWGISIAAIWIRHDDDFESARELIDQYQKQRQVRYSEQNEIESLGQRWRRRPIDFILVAIALAAILSISVWPFLSAFT